MANNARILNPNNHDERSNMGKTVASGNFKAPGGMMVVPQHDNRKSIPPSRSPMVKKGTMSR